MISEQADREQECDQKEREVRGLAHQPGGAGQPVVSSRGESPEHQWNHSERVEVGRLPAESKPGSAEGGKPTDEDASQYRLGLDDRQGTSEHVEDGDTATESH
ncbi:hypothetical protein [Haladaptatus sp. NG-SE-30]